MAMTSRLCSITINDPPPSNDLVFKVTSGKDKREKIEAVVCASCAAKIVQLVTAGAIDTGPATAPKEEAAT